MLSRSVPFAAPAKRRWRALARRRAGEGGFTLIELSIALVGGLIVAAAVMGVSKEATTTFHEEVRVAGAEMGLRIAMERIRVDLQRAAYMGTGNIAGDPMIARAANYAGVTPNLSNFAGVPPYPLLTLSGVALYPGSASALSDATASAQLALNGLTPDVIDITGNMSTSDEYAAAVVWNPPGAGACQSGLTGAALSIQMTTPAGWRIRNAETAASVVPGYVPGLALQAAFHPGPSVVSQFPLKLTDQSGRVQYLLGCVGGAGVATSYNPNGAIPTAIVYLDPRTAVLTSSQTGGNGGVAGFAAGWVTVSPLETAQWDIMSPAELEVLSPATYNSYVYNQTAAANDPTDLLLTRGYVDFSGSCGTWPCTVDPTTIEVVSEYAVDMKFGLTIDESLSCTSATVTALSPTCPTAAPGYAAPPLVNLALGSITLGSSPYLVSGTYLPNVGPQRIRDVQVRLGIRSPFGDRALNLAPPPSTALGPGYLLRYQLNNSSPHFAPGTPYARVRESTTEVNLPNQGRFYY